MRTIEKKTQYMYAIEMRHKLPIEEVLRIKFVDENKTLAQICEELDIAYVTLIKWLKLAGIWSRRIKMEEG